MPGVIPENLRGRLLSQLELVGVASSVAAHSHLWERLVRHDADQRVFEELLTDEHLSVWLICWMEGHDTGFHDHDGSAGSVSVVRGRLREERLRIGGPPASLNLGRGRRRSASRPPTSTGSRTPAERPRFRSTPTRRPCSAWAPT